jgi:FkbM family methyltransferase
VINRLRSLHPQDYEERVHGALQSAIHQGDVVWDVGANVGVYTEQFCHWVGDRGWVVAFEPFAGACDAIRRRLPDCAWVQIENIALGDADMTAKFVTGADSTENHLVNEADATGDPDGAVAVTVARGDTFAARCARLPNVIKVDVEGFEQEVLTGLGETLRSPEVRSVLVEVHFMKLEKRGRPNAPIAIEQMLKSKGFRTRWVDASHLFATR